MRPVLDDLELPQVQEITTLDRRVLAEHKPPAMAGSLLQNLGRRPARLNLWGVAVGPEALGFVQKLDDKFRAGKPVPFIADIVAEAQIEKVVIDDLRIQDLAGKPERFAYVLTLREYIEPVVPEEIPPPPPPPPLPPVETGTLIVEVNVEGEPNFDYSRVELSLEGPQAGDTPSIRVLTQRDGNVWTEEKLTPGQYTAKALVPNSPARTGSAVADVRAGEQTQTTIKIQPQSTSNVAKTFIVHFRMDSAFVEPAMRDVLMRVAQYAADHPAEKLITLGHTDLVGSSEYNQKLSERRARSVYAFLSFGRDGNARNESIAEWNTLRQTADQSQRDIQDNWGTREYQFMLQDLYKYYGNIDGIHGPKTIASITAFQQENTLSPTGIMDDPTWEKLIEEYLGLDPLTIPENQFFRNAKDGCNGGILKWLGAGEQDPVKNTQDAWRPNRRTELLFVQAEQIPCEVPKPRTFGKLNPNGTWCLGQDLNMQPEASIKRVEFLVRQEAQPNKWLVQPAEPGQILINGTITRDTDDGPGIEHAKYALIAPDGTYLHTDADGKPDLGERPQGEQRGQAIPNRADENGAFSYLEPTPEGTYTLELLGIDEPAVARWKRPEEDWEAKGSIVFKQVPSEELITGKVFAAPREGSTVGAVVRPSGPTSPPQAQPIIEVSAPYGVLVKKTYTNPDRKQIRLKIAPPSSIGKWILTCSGDTGAINLYKTMVRTVFLTL